MAKPAPQPFPEPQERARKVAERLDGAGELAQLAKRACYWRASSDGSVAQGPDDVALMQAIDGYTGEFAKRHLQ